MPKLEYTYIDNWQKFNFLGKRLFDFANIKLNILIREYIGTGEELELFVDIIPLIIIIISDEDRLPVFCINELTDILCKDFLGNTLTDAIIEIPAKKNSFILGTNTLVNEVDINYHFIVIGN